MENEVKQTLDLSAVSANEYKVITRAYEVFLNNNDRLRFFGYVDKNELKDICKDFHYTDKRSFRKGLLVGIGMAAAGVVISCKQRKQKKELKEELE